MTSGRLPEITIILYASSELFGGDWNVTSTPVASSCLWAQASNALEYPAAIILTTDAQKAVAEIDNISNYINEMTYKFITGAEPLTNFDTYMDNLQKMGIENLIQLHQEAYDSFMSRGK